MIECINHAWDLHVHTSPDVIQRKLTDSELAERFIKAGLSGAVIKCHYEDTAGRTANLNERYGDKGVRFFGGVVLNNYAGGINHHAVEASGKIGGRYVWFPTMDSKHYMNYRKIDSHDGICILDDKGKVIPEAMRVLETAKKYNMIVGTGHMSVEEGIALVKANADIGCRIVLTHADNPADMYSIEQQNEAVKSGALIEHSYFTIFYNRVTIESLTEQIRAVGTENVFLTTDFGQPASLYPDEGLEEFAKIILGQGFNESETRMMFRDTPAKLLEI